MMKFIIYVHDPKIIDDVPEIQTAVQFLKWQLRPAEIIEKPLRDIMIARFGKINPKMAYCIVKVIDGEEEVLGGTGMLLSYFMNRGLMLAI